MPDANRQQTMWTPTGNPDTTNISTTDWNSMGSQPGQLGTVWDYRERVYQRVQLDSGAVAANPSGVVAANQAAYWKSKDNFIVTNDRRQSLYGSATQAYQNSVAGVFRIAATAGNYIDIIKKGNNIPVADGGNTYAVGEMVFAENDSVAAFDRVGVGTWPSFQKVGVARGTASGGNVNIDLDVLEISK